MQLKYPSINISKNCLVHALTGCIFGGKHPPILFYIITIFADLKNTESDEDRTADWL